MDSLGIVNMTNIILLYGIRIESAYGHTWHSSPWLKVLALKTCLTFDKDRLAHII